MICRFFIQKNWTKQLDKSRLLVYNKITPIILDFKKGGKKMNVIVENTKRFIEKKDLNKRLLPKEQVIVLKSLAICLIIGLLLDHLIF